MDTNFQTLSGEIGFMKCYSKELLKAQITKTRKFLDENLLNKAQFQIISTYICDQENIFEKHKRATCTVTIPIADKAQLQKLNGQIKSDPELYECLKIECSVSVGDTFTPVEPITRVESEETKGKSNVLYHTPDTVLLLLNLSSPNEGLMLRVQQIATKFKAEWKEKFNTAVVYSNEDSESINSNASQHSISGIDQYIISKNQTNPLTNTYGTENCPTVLLVDVQGKIAYMDYQHFNIKDLETKIEKLLTTEKSEKQAQVEEDGMPAIIYKRIRDSAKKGSLRSQAELKVDPENQGWIASFAHTKTFNRGFNLISINRGLLNLSGYVQSQTVQSIKQVLIDFPKEYIIVQLEEIKTISLAFGDKCSACSEALTKANPQYYSFQDKLYFCTRCADSDDKSKVGVNRFVNPHALIYIQPSTSLISIEEDRILDQSQPITKEEEDAVTGHNGIRCDGCKHSMINDELRWKCLSCADLDICHECFEFAKDQDEDTIEDFKAVGHELDHILQRFHFQQESGIIEAMRKSKSTGDFFD